MSVAEEVAQILLSIKAVTINPVEPYRYTSGLLSPVYTDNRILISHPRERRRVIDAWIDLIKGLKEFDIIAGTATAGIPHAAWISDKMDKPMVYIRSEAKKHGKHNQIEGVLKPGQKVAIVEDLISTGRSSLESNKAVVEAGGIAGHVIGIFRYGLPQSIENFKQAGVKLDTLTNFHTVVQVAEKNGDLGPMQKELVLDWLNDSAGWGKRHGFE